MDRKPSPPDPITEQSEPSGTTEPFPALLTREGLKLVRDEAVVLQINTGLLCNQVCGHCHLEAGPNRSELMDLATLEHIVSFALRCRFKVIDITGGAPEMNPHLPIIIERLAPLAPKIMLRSNLTALTDGHRDHLMEICKDHRVVVVASFPSLNKGQAESQRGKGIFEKSIAALQKLNSMGYGQVDSGLELDLVSNAVGAFLPASQNQAEMKFRKDLQQKWGIVFNHLYTFANVPLGRFLQWLKRSGNYDKYMEKLAARFNACTLEGLMCRTLVSVSWDGYLYDCDFNLAKRLSLGGRKMHVTEMEGPPPVGSPIAVGDHCYACTAGTGFT